MSSPGGENSKRLPARYFTLGCFIGDTPHAQAALHAWKTDRPERTAKSVKQADDYLRHAGRPDAAERLDALPTRPPICNRPPNRVQYPEIHNVLINLRIRTPCRRLPRWTRP
ncbi:MAG: hypothetical protein K2Q09_00890 [Phycisphaerales bacterium]|nr:hypothetical protein [Phycisphaerales bacterium]